MTIHWLCRFFFCVLVLVLDKPGFASEKVLLAVPVVAVQYAPIFLGFKQGLFAEEGLDLEINVVRTDLAIAGLSAGKLDYISHGGAALRSAIRGFPIKLIFALDDKAAFWLMTQSQIHRVSELKGKKIGVSFPGDTPYLVLKRFLKERGLDPENDVTYVSGQISPIGLQGMSAGVLDGAVMAPPYSVIAEKMGFLSLAFLGKEVPDAPTINGIITSNAKIRSQRHQVQRMVRAMLRSFNLYRQKKDLAVAYLASEYKLDHTIARQVYSNSLTVLTPAGEVSLDKIRDALNLVKESGQDPPVIKKPESLLDFSFLHEARRAKTANGTISTRP